MHHGKSHYSLVYLILDDHIFVLYLVLFIFYVFANFILRCVEKKNFSGLPFFFLIVLMNILFDFDQLLLQLCFVFLLVWPGEAEVCSVL